MSEFPVEAADGSVWMIRETRGLLQAASLDRATGAITPLTAYPSGAFLLHRSAPGRIAAVAQVGIPEQWRLAPVEITAPALPAAMPDQADFLPPPPPPPPTAAYRAPGFLGAPPLFPGPILPPENPGAGRGYLSLLEIRPLILWPYLVSAYPSGAAGAGALLQIPWPCIRFRGASEPGERRTSPCTMPSTRTGRLPWRSPFSPPTRLSGWIPCPGT